MAAAPLVGGNDNDADSRARNVVVKSETVDVEYVDVGVQQPRVAASLGERVADGTRFAEDGHGESTECSSSFGDSCFASDDDDVESDAGVMEVDSPFYSHTHINADDDDTTDVPRYARKKKVTDDWRNFIGPERWRCQWLELRMKDLLSQVAKYDRELALIKHEKDLQLEMIEADGPKSLFDLPSHERNTMKKRKRKRHEDNTDTSLYIKKHQILSYYNPENKRNRADIDKSGFEKAEANELLLNDCFNSLLDVEDTKKGLGSKCRLLELKEKNNALEQYSLREILLTLQRTQSRIINLQNILVEAHNKIDHSRKSRKVCSRKIQKVQKKRNSRSFCRKKDQGTSIGVALSILSDESTESDTVDTTQQNEDEITIDMLFDVNNPRTAVCIGGICKESADDVLIDNQAACEEGFCQFERVKETPKTKSELVKNVVESTDKEETTRARFSLNKFSKQFQL